MTYEPQVISRSAMFLANKTENHNLTAEKYAAALKNTTPDQVLAPEYLITQALRFTFDVRHPFRGLKGGHMELFSMAQGNSTPLPWLSKSADDLRREMLALPVELASAPSQMSQPQLNKRITDAYAKSSQTLKIAGILTDAYFLFSPAQIWLAAHMLADEVLTRFYLSTKLPPGPSFDKIESTIRSCSVLLSAHPSTAASSAQDPAKDQATVQSLIKKLRNCRDPDKLDLVKLNKSHKRYADPRKDEQKAKRRKLERDALAKESDAFWGPEIKKEGE